VTRPSWGGRSGKVVSAGKHGVVIEDNGAKHKLFWDEVESVKKPGKHGETTAAWKPSEPGLVDPAKARAALEAAGWKVAAKGITTNSYERPDHPGHGIGLSDEGAWAHNRFKNGNPSAGRSATRSLFPSPDTGSWRGGAGTVPSPAPSEAKHPKHCRDGARFEPLVIRTRPPGCPVAAAGYRRGGGTTGRGVGSGGT